MRLSLLTASIAVSAAVCAQSITPLWMRDIAISPDGLSIAFTYKGDIYTVNSNGGMASCLTNSEGHNTRPVWSPDSRTIAFASTRQGSADIYTVPATGGVAKRLTFYSGKETPESFTPDGKQVVFSAFIQDPAKSAAFPAGNQTELYTVSIDNAAIRLLAPVSGTSISFLPDGSFLYDDVKGSEDKWRKHHTSSMAHDIWICNPDQNSYRQLTFNIGEDRNAVAVPQTNQIYFLRETPGHSFNIHIAPIDNLDNATAVTEFKTHPVRFLSIASNGTAAFGYNGEIYTLKPGEKPAKLNVSLIETAQSREKRISISGPDSDGKVSPSGKQLAFIDRGELFVTSVKYPSIKQITHTPEAESHLCWGKDDREIYYDSQRDGHYNIYRCSIVRDEDPDFSNATIVKEESVFTSDGIDRSFPKLSPDGKMLAYIQDRVNLMVMELATGKSRLLTDTTSMAHRNGGFDVEWSPDSRWITFAQLTPVHDPYSDIVVVNALTGEKHLVTNTGYFDENPHWAFDGEAIIFNSERYGMRNHAYWGSEYDVMAVFLTQDAYDRFRLSEEDFALYKEVKDAQKKAEKKEPESKNGKGKKIDTAEKYTEKISDPKELDFSNLDFRTVRLTPNSSALADALVTKDGNTLYYLSKFEDDYDLWKKDLRKGDVSRVSQLNNGQSVLQADNEGNIYIIGNKVKKLEGDKTKPVSTSTYALIDPYAERKFMFEFVKNEERERFYDPQMHGVDWQALTDNYRRFLPHISNNTDFADMLSELLGELNVSHTGSRYFAPSPTNPTATLGLLYDFNYTGKGVKVDDIIKRGPFDRSNTEIVPGSVINAINGEETADIAQLYRQLAGLSKRKTLVTFTLPGGKSISEVILPITVQAQNALLYDRWVANREKDVDSLSNGRLGYVHLESMDDDSFRRIYAKMMGQYKGKEGIVIDTRWNGGGRLHEDIEVLLSGEKYLQQYVHGVKTAEMPSRRWNKPSIMLIGEANYSNAHGTPWVYKYKKLGKLVGMPVPGTMTSVNWVWLQDPSLLFGIPVTGYKTASGEYLENSQLEPDIKIANNAAELAAGRDRQLETAVFNLLKEIDQRD